jgi:phage terminase small subunit
MHKDRLTERQRLFCEMYVGPGRHNSALSARLAGYAPGCSHVTGCQLLQLPKIAATVRGLEDAVSQDMGVTRQMFLRQLQVAADMAKEKMEPSAMLAAWRQIGLACGFYAPETKRVEIDAEGQNAMQRLESLPDAALLEMIAAGSAG